MFRVPSSRRALISRPPARSFFDRLPEIGSPVLNEFWYRSEDGSRKIVIIYEALVTLNVGPPREIIVSFDLEGLRKRLHAN
jgi:hypothetical protein